MASLQALKKHLGSVRMTGQLAGAMKTVSAVKLSRVNGTLQNFSAYDTMCREILNTFGTELAAVYPCINPEAPVCYVLLGANRGLCGGYNIELYSYADTVLAEAPENRLLIAVGKHAVSHLNDAGTPPDKTWLLPDTVTMDDCEPLIRDVLTMYREGRISAVILLYQKFVNMLTQTPSSFRLLPLAEAEQSRSEEAPLFVPDSTTVLQSAASACLNAAFYTRILEVCAGHQASTLIAMRSAYDNAEASAAALESDISRKRQSDVTASVIETSGSIPES